MKSKGHTAHQSISNMDVSSPPYLTTGAGAGAGTIALLLILLTCLVRKWCSFSSKTKLAPTAGGGWPIIGHLPVLAGSDLPHIMLGGLADKYGPIFSLRIGSHPALVVSSSEIARECFTTNDRAFLSRPNMVASRQLGYNLAMFGTAPDGPYWREVRKISASELLSNTRLEQLKHVQVSEVSAWVDELHALCSEKGSHAPSGGHVLVDMKGLLGDFSLKMIVRMIAGKRYAGGGGEEARRWKKVMRDIFRLLSTPVVSDAFPSLEWLDIGGHIKAMKRTAKELDDILEGWLEEHRRKRLSGPRNDDAGETDFMDVLLTVLDGRDDFFGHDTDTVIKATSASMVIGAADTTAVTVTWAISLLLNNPDSLKKAEEELRTQIGYKDRVNGFDISKLVYLEAVIKETWRLYPPAPLLAPRECIEDCVVAGNYVSKGTRLIVNAWKIQRDPRTWSDPLSFRPERFLDKDVDVRGHHFELIPFGSGRRVCPGLSFAVQTTHLVLASFLHAFDISNPSSESVDMKESFGATNMKATPLEILIKSRFTI